MAPYGGGFDAGAFLSDAANSPMMQEAGRVVGGIIRSARKGQPAAIMCILLVIGSFVFIFQFFFQDREVNVGHLIPAGSLCANQEDMYDDTRSRCQMGNKYAYAYLLGHSWVMCAPNMPGAQLLRKTLDSYGNFWYHSEDRDEVRRFYKTCIPTCASDQDTYHSSKDMCLLSNDKARVWLAGEGQKCQRGTAGAKAIRTASKEIGDGNFWYKPEMASRVKEFYDTCHATCAKGDVAADPEACNVMNRKALAWFRNRNGDVTCDDPSPGKSAIMRQVIEGSTKYWYMRSEGEKVEAWYTSCMRQPPQQLSMVNDNDKKEDVPLTVTPDGRHSFRFPKAAKPNLATLCNFSGKTYWYSSSHKKNVGGRSDMYVTPIKDGGECTTVKQFKCGPVDGFGNAHQHCGFLSPCKDLECDHSKAMAVQGGINIISSLGSLQWLPAPQAD